MHLVHTAGHVGSRAHLQDTDLTGRATGLARMLVRLSSRRARAAGVARAHPAHRGRGPARTDAEGDLVLLAHQDRSLGGTAPLIRQGLARTTAALRHPRQQQVRPPAAVAGCRGRADVGGRRLGADRRDVDALIRTSPSPSSRSTAPQRAAAPAPTSPVLREIDDLALDGYPYLPAARPTSSPAWPRRGGRRGVRGGAGAHHESVERRYLALRVISRGHP